MAGHRAAQRGALASVEAEDGQLGVQAAAMLVERIRGASGPPRVVVVPNDAESPEVGVPVGL